MIGEDQTLYLAFIYTSLRDNMRTQMTLFSVENILNTLTLDICKD